MSLRLLSSCSSRLPVLTLFTNSAGCSLCDEAKIVLDKYKNKFIYEEVHIDRREHSQWYKMYCYDIPVIHLNGTYLMKHRVNEHKLLKALTSTRSSSVE